MGKRSNQTAAKSTSKRSKVDPALAVVMDTVKKASHLPEQCSAMLASMLPFSLAIAADERADSQQQVVGMLEQTLHAIKTEMEGAAATEEAKLEKLKATMTELLGAVKEAEAVVAARKEALEVASASLADATAAVNASGETLAERQSAHTTCEAKLASVQEDKVALEQAFQAHFQIPMEAGEGPHFKELEPFLQNMEIETSLHSTLPGTCAKTKENRGSFDDVILEQLEKAITAKISALAETVTLETSALAERAAAVSDAEAELNLKKEVQTRSTLELEGAQKEQSDGDSAFVKANEAVNEFRHQLEEATELCEFSKSKLLDFENGALTNFTTFKTRTVSTEAAPLGA